MRLRLPGLVEIAAGNPGPLTGTGNRTWLLLGAATTLVDAGVGHPSHLDAVAATLDTAGRSLERVVVTHGHPDHASGVEKLAVRWPGARFSKRPWPEVDGRYLASWQPLADGELVEAGDTRLEVIATPGHAPDHICLWHAASKTLFGGDLLIEGATVVVPGTRGGNMRDYLASLARVAALAPEQVLPAHGPDIGDPLALIARYIAHRKAREREVLAALGAGACDAEAIVTAIYPQLSGPLRLAATESAHAHIRKLVDEGRVRELDGRLELTSACSDIPSC